MSYFLDDDASQVRDLKDKLDKLQSDFLSNQFSVSQENAESGQSTFLIANPSARGGGALIEPLLHTITTVTPVTLPTKTNIDSALTNVFKITLDRNIEFDITNPNATKFEMLHIMITQDATTAGTITWPASVNGIPTIDATLGSETTVSLFNMGDGTWRFVSTKSGVINGAAVELNDLTDVTLVAPCAGNYLRCGGTVWSNPDVLWPDVDKTGSSLDDFDDTLIGTPSANTIIK